MKGPKDEELRCDVLLLFATTTEEEALKSAAKGMNLDFVRKTVPELGKHYQIGMVGSSRVIAIRTEMGPFSHGGSASKAIHSQIKTGATAIIQLGMAFGIDPKEQKIGDVLVSTSLIPYDLRVVRTLNTTSLAMPGDKLEDDSSSPDDLTRENPIESGNVPESNRILPPKNTTEEPLPNAAAYVVDYTPARRHPAKASLIKLFEVEWNRTEREHKVFLGGMLSGGARIFSRSFLEELVRGIPQAEDGIIGGEMEGVGLLSVSPRKNPIWAVVKGISDFADENRDSIIKESRKIACENSAHFVLSALLNGRP